MTSPLSDTKSHGVTKGEIDEFSNLEKKGKTTGEIQNSGLTVGKNDESNHRVTKRDIPELPSRREEEGKSREEEVANGN